MTLYLLYFRILHRPDKKHATRFELFKICMENLFRKVYDKLNIKMTKSQNRPKIVWDN